MISLVVPVLNEGPNIDAMFTRVRAAAETWGEDWELLFVDDGSTDDTLGRIAQLNAADARVKVVSFSRNFGHQTAVTAGLHHASGDAVIVLDADLQDPPEELIHFIEKWREGYEVVYGIRRKRKENPLKRLAYFGFYRLLAKLSSIEIPLDSGDFGLMDRKVVDCLNAMPERNRFVRGLRSWVGFKQIGVAYERHARAAGDVKYTFTKLVGLACDGIFNFSYRPLQLLGGFGLIVAGLSALAIAFTLTVWVFDIRVKGYSIHDLPGYTSLFLAILFIGGVQLISIGLIGEYLGRIFEEIKQRPHYIINTTLGLTAAQAPQPYRANFATPPKENDADARLTRTSEVLLRAG